jgi:hypothetical protein
MTRIDRAFCTPEWEDTFVYPMLQPMSYSVSNHCPSFCHHYIHHKPRQNFVLSPGHKCSVFNTVRGAWERDIPVNQHALAALHIKLSRTAMALKSWSKSLVPQGKAAMTICSEVIAPLENVQENRIISQGEKKMIKDLKLRSLGLAAIEKNVESDKDQELLGLEKEMPTQFIFHLMANNRKRKNFIHSLQTDSWVAMTQSKKHHVIYNNFLEHTCTYTPRGNVY